MSQQINSDQHNFRQNKSIITNLILHQFNIVYNFNRGQQINSIYTDFQKVLN